jgi:hypothetical protein
MDNLSLYNLEVMERQAKEKLDKVFFSEEPNNTENDLAVISELLMQKVDNVVGYRNSLESYEQVIENKIADLIEKRDHIKSRLEKLDSYVNASLVINQKTEIIGSFYKIVKRKPSRIVSITNEKLIPLDYLKIPEVKPMIMKKEIGDALKSGQEVPGAALIDSDKVSISYKLK